MFETVADTGVGGNAALTGRVGAISLMRVDEGTLEMKTCCEVPDSGRRR